MTSTNATFPLPAVPTEVLAFAAEQGVTAYLDPVLAMTRQVFPGAQQITVAIEDDPEIADDRHIVIAVKAGGLEVPQALEQRSRWHRELFTCCPAPLVCTFRLALEVGR
jgi:hypothetical protein